MEAPSFFPRLCGECIHFTKNPDPEEIMLTRIAVAETRALVRASPFGANTSRALRMIVMLADQVTIEPGFLDCAPKNEVDTGYTFTPCKRPKKFRDAGLNLDFSRLA